MSDAYISEIRIFPFNFAPKGWAMCNGQTMSINQNQALFSLLGTTYGGNGQTTFGLPNLQGRVPLHFGQGQGLSAYNLGQTGGESTHTLLVSEIPQHVHTMQGEGTAGTFAPPSGRLLAASDAAKPYGPATNLTTLQPGTLANAGSSQPHENKQPYLTLTFCICLLGIFPSRN